MSAPSMPLAVEHPPSEARAEPDEWAVEEVVVDVGSSRHVLRKPVQPEDLLQTLVSGDTAASTTDDLNSSDLVSGVYEGGFKLWECARDVMEVMERRRLEGKLAVRGARVLEAGCGAGLPGGGGHPGGRQAGQQPTLATTRRVGCWPACSNSPKVPCPGL